MAKRDLTVCIVGAGMSGLCMGIALRKAGIERFRILEKADSVGGTWRENRYPGLTCDVPSYFYSFSFEPNPGWTHRFAPGPEIRAYFEGVAEKYDLLPHVDFGREVTRARWEDGGWKVAASGGEDVTADVLVLACGPLHKKKYPDLPGTGSFEGAIFHSADWPDDLPLEGKRIAVVGTGSSAVQMMQPLSRVASHLTMFQRTAQWIVPVGNKRYGEATLRRARRLPFIPWLTRQWFKLSFERFSDAVVVPGKRREMVAAQCRRYLASVRDPELRAKLTPDYEPMCKRLILSSTFYPTLYQDHVDLVTEKIQGIEPRGIRTTDGTLHEQDVIVLATGFDAHSWGVDQVVGEHGKSLTEAWAEGDRSHRSVAFPGFPNFFTLVGPNSPIGNVSVIDVSEVQTRYILQCLEKLRSGEAREIAPRPEASKAFHASAMEAMKDTVWVTGCNSWYLDEQGTPVTWPWSAKRFHRDMRRPDFSEFELRRA